MARSRSSSISSDTRTHSTKSSSNREYTIEGAIEAFEKIESAEKDEDAKWKVRRDGIGAWLFLGLICLLIYFSNHSNISKEIKQLPYNPLVYMDMAGDYLLKSGRERFIDYFIFGLLYGYRNYLWCTFLFKDHTEHKNDTKMEEFKTKLQYVRFNVSLNILEKPTKKRGPSVLHMRTITEGKLMDVFTDKTDPLLLGKLLVDEQNAAANNLFFPYVNLSTISTDEGFIMKNVKKTQVHSKLVDQLTNFLSQSFRTAFVAQDLGLDFVSEKYYYGLTYEKQTDHKNRKARILLMRKSQLEMLTDGSINIDYLIDESRSVYGENYAKYLKQRLDDLEMLRAVVEEPGGNKSIIAGTLFIAHAK